MKLTSCEFCGTEYDSTLTQCPLCGKAIDQLPRKEKPIREKKQPKTFVEGDRTVQKQDTDPSSRGLWIAISVILGVAVLAGLVFFLYIMGLFGDFNTKPVNQEPVDLPEYNYETQLPEESLVTEEIPEEETEKVNPGACTGLSISKHEETLEEAGDKFFLTAVAKPSNCTDPIEYRSSDETIATVNVNGMVTAIGPGVVDIIVTCGEMMEICTVTCGFGEEISDEEIDTPVLSMKELTLGYPGEKAQLSVNNASEDATVKFVSRDESVATVSLVGEVTAVADGETIIEVTVDDTVLSCTVRVNMESSTEDSVGDEFTAPFALSHTDVTLFSTGDSFTLTLRDANGTVVPVGWFASNGCVTIAGNSMQAVASGQCTVSCVYKGVTYSCIIRCNF